MILTSVEDRGSGNLKVTKLNGALRQLSRIYQRTANIHV